MTPPETETGQMYEKIKRVYSNNSIYDTVKKILCIDGGYPSSSVSGIDTVREKYLLEIMHAALPRRLQTVGQGRKNE